MDGPRLAIVIPAYREAATIGAVIDAARHHGEVIVVDDGSPDATAEVAERNRAVVVRNATNVGYEGSLNRGFEEAAKRGFTHVVTLDADGEHDPDVIARVRRLMFEEQIALVLGVRPRKQRLAEQIMGLYVSARYGAKDILCGLKGYDLDLWRANGSFDTSGNVGTELATSALRRGVAFREVPVIGKPRGDAPRFDSRLRANWRILRALVRLIRADLLGSKRPLAR